MKFKAIDLFCGAGGLSTGLKKSGFRLCLGVDIDEKALKTYKCRVPAFLPVSLRFSDVSGHNPVVVLSIVFYLDIPLS